MASTMSAQKAFLGSQVESNATRSRGPAARNVVMASSKKTDIKKQGLESIKDPVVKANLMGISRKMQDKNWTDSQGRKGKGFGVYRFASKYGANVDGYSPIYTPDTWAETGDSYSLGTKGLLAWAGLVTVLLAVGATLIYSTSQLGQ
ncbi:g3250 [Coccomyxa elongata]|nr:probable photosystem II 10 kDa polypeptide, chloroplastic at C-terminar half [Coccomyxa sp. Obi]